MTSLRWESRPEGLRSPALVVAFTGWNDAAQAASTALEAVGRSVDARRVGHLDPDCFLDFQMARPLIDLTEGAAHELAWPEFALHAAPVPGAPRDLLLLGGPEPSYRWRAFCGDVLDAAQELGVEMLVGLGALLADVPHTRSITLTGIASPPHLVDGMPFRAPSYQGPTGILGALHALAAERGIDAVSLWAPVPHYLAGAPNPAGALAIVRAMERVTGVVIDGGQLEDATAEWERQVNAAVERDPAAQALVERLERAAESDEPAFDPGGLPSGDALARDVERFLRQREAGPEA